MHLEFRNVIDPLSNNAQIRVAPGRVDTQLKSRPSLELASSVSRQVGMTSAKQVGIPRSAKLWTNRIYHPTGPREPILRIRGPLPASPTVRMENQLGPPLEM